MATGEEAVFEHVVITRFSVTFTPEQPTPDDEWLAYRLGFFTEATVASMVGQTCQRFRWLVFCDDRGPQWLRETMDELAAQSPLEPVWLHGPWTPAAAAAEVARRTAAPWLISTRLDSDDALGRRYVERLQQEFGRQDRLYVNFTRGLQLERSGAVHRFDYAANPFVSLIERRAEGVPWTAFHGGTHPDVRTRADVREIAEAPMWLQVVHGGNLLNIVRGTRAHPRLLTDNFTIDLGHDERTSPATLLLGRLRQRGRLLGLWSRRPGLLLEYAAGRRHRLRGTRTRAHQPGKT